MAQHVAIDIEAEIGKAPICVVCMEPMEWVAVSPCGHQEVCVNCAAVIRFFHSDLRCCICRSHCSTIVVTKANSRSASGQQGFPFFLWPPSPAFASEVLVGHYYWYHRGMRAYFDDMNQYQEMKKVCTTSSSSEESRAAGGAPVVNSLGRYREALFRQPAPNANANLNISVPPRQAAEAPPSLVEPSSSSEDVGKSLRLFGIAVVVSLLTIGGFFMLDEHPYRKVLIVVPVSVLFPAITACTIYAWRKFQNNSLQRDG